MLRMSTVAIVSRHGAFGHRARGLLECRCDAVLAVVEAASRRRPSLAVRIRAAGRRVRTAQGQTCRTPCSLAVPVTSQSVTFAMNGFVPQTIQVAGASSRSIRSGQRAAADSVPNPVAASMLQAAPPPPRQAGQTEAAQDVARPAPRQDRRASGRDTRRPQPSLAAPPVAIPAPRQRRSRRRRTVPSPLALPAQPPAIAITAPASFRQSAPAETFWTIRALSGTIAAYLNGGWTACRKPCQACRTRRRTRAAGAGRSVRPRHHLSARLGHRPLRFPLRLLHGGEHVVPAEGRSSHAGRTRPAVLGLHRARRAQAAPDRRRAAGAARHHDARRLAVAPSALRHARRTDADHQRLAARQICRRVARRPACGASTSRSTRSMPKNSAPSRAGARWIRCSPASTPRRRPA